MALKVKSNSAERLEHGLALQTCNQTVWEDGQSDRHKDKGTARMLPC